MIKDIIAYLDGSSVDEVSIQHAESVATSFQAHLTGFLGNPLPDYALLAPDGGFGTASVLADIEEDARRAGDDNERRVADRFTRLGAPNNLRRVDALASGLASRAAAEARCADLFVIARPSSGGGGRANTLQSTTVLEAVLFEGGRGVYIVPPERPPSDVIRRVMVCWRDTRETARAVSEALPFISKANRTAVLSVRERGPGEDAEPGADIAGHLDRHGATVEVLTAQAGDRSVGDVILDQASRMSADLIVLGAYGHSRLREWALGGVTADLLNSSQFPLLMAH
jgi:nucleotide-binding universal stress UspA family protein